MPGFVSSSAALAGAGDCENDGTIVTPPSTNASSATTFTNCEIAGAILDGVIGRAVLAQGIVLGFQDFTITKVANGKSLTINGQLAVTTSDVGKRIAGKLTVVSSERGTFTVEFQRILMIGDGSVREGLLIFDLTDATHAQGRRHPHHVRRK